MPFENNDPWTSVTPFDGPWVPATWLRAKLSMLRAKGIKLALENESVFVDYACQVCGGCAPAEGLEFSLIEPLPESERAMSTDGGGRVDGVAVCWHCAKELDPALFDAREKLRASPLAELYDCQSTLWRDKVALAQSLAAHGLRLLDAESRTIVIKEPEAA